MTYLQWNLDPLEEKEIDIYQINILTEALEETQSNNDKRLLVLSHLLGFQQIPAFFLPKAPPYSKHPIDQSVIIVFDLYHKFELEEKFHSWCEITSWKYDFSLPYDHLLFEDLQSALNVASYYEFEQLRPIYFTSFLLFPQSGSFTDPFLYQKIPIRSKFSLSIRTHIQSCSQFILDYPDPIPQNSYVLIAPFDHPFLVLSSTDKFITVKAVDNITMTFEIASTLFVLITHPSILLPKFYVSDSMPQSRSLTKTDSRKHVEPKEHSFDQVLFFDYSKSAIELGMIRSSPDNVFMQTDDEVIDTPEVIEFSSLTIDQILSQIVIDKAKRKAISKCIGKGEPPSNRFTLTLPASPSITLSNFGFCFSNCKVPFHAESFMTTNSIPFEKLPIPKVVVQSGAQFRTMPANQLIKQWKPEQYLPISNKKDAHFIVFSISTISVDLVKTFFSSFCNSYTLMNFGKLSPLPSGETYSFLSFEDMPVIIKGYIDQQKLIEFRQFPLIIFIVAPRIYDEEFNPHALISYIDPAFIQTANTDEIESITFDLYSTIRIFNPFPFGMSNFPNKLPEKLFFGYRYQPFFYLEREDKNIMYLHIGWDEATQTASFVDEIGSVFDVIPNIEIKDINSIINDLKRLFGAITVKFTLSILSEGITENLSREIHENIESENMNHLLVFAVSPQPNIQILFDESFDAMIFAPTEQFMQSVDGTEFLMPSSSCYVVCNSLNAYSISFYSDPLSIRVPPQQIVYQFAHQMSKLSWLSIKPRCENRAISYPPHISALLKKTNSPVKRISKYEFLPSFDRA